jgi:hypothetical protein
MKQRLSFRAKRGISLCLRPDRRTNKQGEIPRFARNDSVFSEQQEAVGRRFGKVLGGKQGLGQFNNQFRIQN